MSATGNIELPIVSIRQRGYFSNVNDPIELSEWALLERIEAAGAAGYKIVAVELLVAMSLHTRDLISAVDPTESPWVYALTSFGRNRLRYRYR